MNYDIIEKPAFNVIGKALRVATKDGENMRRIPAFWNECIADGTLDRLDALRTAHPIASDGLLGICSEFAPDMSEFTYTVAVEAGAEATSSDLMPTLVPALTWATFDAHGAVKDVIQSVWGEIMSDFFEKSGYAHGPGPDVEVYPKGDPANGDYSFQVWVPVVGK